MIYLDEFRFLDSDDEWDYFRDMENEMSYDSLYPFQMFPNMEWSDVIFDAVTIFYGGNGSGKSTALNLIAEKLHLARESSYNHSALFDDYVDRCDARVPAFMIWTQSRWTLLHGRSCPMSGCIMISFRNTGMNLKRTKPENLPKFPYRTKNREMDTTKQDVLRGKSAESGRKGAQNILLCLSPSRKCPRNTKNDRSWKSHT